MKKQILVKIFFTFIILSLGSCRDPVFYTISQEEKQLEPLIKGSPTNFVKFNGKMYVGSGTTLYRYDGTMSSNQARGEWTSSTPGGNILQLAVTDVMYALCEVSGDRILKSSSNGTKWDNVSFTNITVIQSIYALNNKLFIGAGADDSFYIYLNDGPTLLTKTENKLLNGAAYDGSNYYLTTKDFISESGGGIYCTSDLLTAQLIGNSNNVPFMGIINLDDTNAASKIVAISRDGILYYVTSSSVTPTGYRLHDDNGNNKLATGALAIWTNPFTYGRLLLVGRQDTMKNSVNYLHGYLELELDSGGIMNNAVFRNPGKHLLSSVHDGNNGSYKSILEVQPINHLFQVSNSYVLFAATQKNGIWSYRQRDGKWLWNSEQ